MCSPEACANTARSLSIEVLKQAETFETAEWFIEKSNPHPLPRGETKLESERF